MKCGTDGMGLRPKILQLIIGKGNHWLKIKDASHTLVKSVHFVCVGFQAISSFTHSPQCEFNEIGRKWFLCSELLQLVN